MNIVCFWHERNFLTASSMAGLSFHCRFFYVILFRHFLFFFATKFRRFFHAMSQSSCLNLYVYFTIINFSVFNKLPYCNGNENVLCEHCCTQNAKPNLAHHKKRCSVGTLYRNQCPNFSTRFHNDRNYHVAKKKSDPNSELTLRCKFLYQNFPGFLLHDSILPLNMAVPLGQHLLIPT